MPVTSAGVLLYRRAPGLQVLVGHMGGPFWARKDEHAWSIPKGELDGDEEPRAAALREFAEELGLPTPDVDYADLGTVRYASGKLLRRSIRALCEGQDPGDLTTIEDPSALEQILAAVRG